MIRSSRRRGAYAKLRPVCLACVSFEVEVVTDAGPADGQLYTCFECRDVFYFLPDTRPKIRRLQLAELYESA